MPTLELDHNGRLFYEITGPPPPAPTIVFLNGTAQTTISWTSQVRMLKADHRIICYDARTQGRHSRLGDGQLNLDVHIADLARLFDHLDLDQAHLVGVSHGALLAASFESRHRERVGNLVLINPGNPGNGRTCTAIRAWHTILRDGGMRAGAWSMLPLVLGPTYLKDHQPLLDGMANAVAVRNRSAALTAHLAAMADYPPLESLISPELPQALFITCDDDPLSDFQAIGTIAASCGGCHRRLPGIGHSLPVEAPSLCTQLIREWLATAV